MSTNIFLDSPLTPTICGQKDQAFVTLDTHAPEFLTVYLGPRGRKAALAARNLAAALLEAADKIEESYFESPPALPPVTLHQIDEPVRTRQIDLDDV